MLSKGVLSARLFNLIYS
ncbi:hypothetical protein [Escherichia coli]|nr:hypothetical protein [Escherichia coli]MCQ1706472.1 protein YchT [Escherichia coli]MEB6010562.1 protein YchT [Escherichia coli]MEB6349215.1 protein YchT [Escherichia coli]